MPSKSKNKSSEHKIMSWVGNRKFFKKVEKETAGNDEKLQKEETWKEAAKEYRLLLPSSPTDRRTLFINRSFRKWKAKIAESKFIDNEFNMCPCIGNGEEVVWRFDTKISGANFMPKFNDWRRTTVSFEQKGYSRNNAMEGTQDFEGGRWYDRDEILQRMFRQKDQAKTKAFVQKRMLDIDSVFSHLRHRLESSGISEKDNEEICTQIKQSLEMLEISYFTNKENPGKKYIWYEDFAMIPFIALDATKFDKQLPWRAIPVNLLLDIEENDYESVLLFLNQASLLRSIKQYQNNKAQVPPISFASSTPSISGNKDITSKYDFTGEKWSGEDDFWGRFSIKADINIQISIVFGHVINQIKKYYLEGNFDEKKDFTKEQQPVEEEFENWFVQGKEILKILKSEVQKNSQEKRLFWKNIKPNDLRSMFSLPMYYPKILSNGNYSVIEVTYPLFFTAESGVAKVSSPETSQYFLVNENSFESIFPDTTFLKEMGYFDLNSERNVAIESMVYGELLRRGYEVAKGKLDIDFTATKEKNKLYIQVTESMNNSFTRERKLSPLRKIKDNYPKLVITDEYPKLVTADGREMKFVAVDGAEMKFVLEDGAEMKLVAVDDREMKFVAADGTEMKLVTVDGTEIKFILVDGAEMKPVTKDGIEIMELNDFLFAAKI